MSEPVLAIAAPSFCGPSETFIRDHVRTIAPGATRLICQDGRDAELLGCPVLAGVPTAVLPVGLQARVAGAIERRVRSCFTYGMRADDAHRTASFIADQGVRMLLAEYLNYAVGFVDACRTAEVPLFVHAHGYDVAVLSQDDHWARRYRWLFQRAAGIIAPSRFLADRLRAIGCPEPKLHVSPCGVDPLQFKPTKRVPGRLLAVGRLVEKKAPDITIEAFARICGHFPEARLDMVGDGPLMAHCRVLVAGHGLEDRIILHGAQPHAVVNDLMAEASIFLQHSVTARNGDTEGLPVAILEAMASGVPIVGTRHSGIPEAVVEGETGVLVDEHDADGMAEAMANLLSDPALAAAMGEAGRRRVLARFTHAHTRDRLRAVMGLPPVAPAAPARASLSSHAQGTGPVQRASDSGWPSVAVVIPCKNAEPWIGRAIASVARQEYPGVDIVVVDDGSTDKSASVAIGANPSVTLLQSKGQGACAARNTGLGHITSDYVIFLDADDYLEGDYFGAFKSLPNVSRADILLSPVIVERHDGSRTSLPRALPKSHALLLSAYLEGKYLQTAAFAWRTDFIRRVGGWDETVLSGQDIELTFRACVFAPSIIVAETGSVVYCLHDHPDRMTYVDTPEKIFSRYNVGCKTKTLFLQNGLSAALPMLGKYFYDISSRCFELGQGRLGRAALRQARTLGYRSHQGSRGAIIFKSLMGVQLYTYIGRLTRPARRRFLQSGRGLAR